MLKSEKPAWGRLRYIRQILGAAQLAVQIEERLLSNRRKKGDLVLLENELETLLNYIRRAGGSVHRFRLSEQLSGRLQVQRLLKHGLGTGALTICPAAAGNNSLDIIQIEEIKHAN